jgi:hypothetical protein
MSRSNIKHQQIIGTILKVPEHSRVVILPLVGPFPLVNPVPWSGVVVTPHV